MGAKVTFLCHPRLVRLFRPFAGEMEVIGFCEADRRFDFQCALMSLAERFRRHAWRSSGHCSLSLRGETVLVEQWRPRLGDRGFRIGICWQAIPSARSIRAGRYRWQNISRSVLCQAFALSRFRRLTAWISSPNCPQECGLRRLVRLTKAKTRSSIPLRSCRVSTSSSRPTRQPRISPARSTVRSGSRSKHIPDWRFMLERGDSPWYPAMRLFRQPARDDWDSVFAAMTAALGVLTRASAGPGSSNIGS